MNAASAPRPGGADRSAFRAAESRQSQSRTPLEDQKQRTCQRFSTPEAARERRVRMLLHSTIRRNAGTGQGRWANDAGNAQQGHVSKVWKFAAGAAFRDTERGRPVRGDG